MNKIDLIFLNILKSALKGEKRSGCDCLTEEEWARIFESAEKHSLLPLIYNASYSRRKIRDSRAIRGRVRRLVTLQTVKTDKFLRLYKKLTDAGCMPIVVKGLVLRRLYPNPDLRMSSDEDILAERRQFDDCLRIMSDFGLNCDMTEGETKTVHEVSFKSDDGILYIELHKSLFPPDSAAYGNMNDLFIGAADRAIMSDGVYTLCPTDHIIYLICHALKHFIHSGFGIRQVCDITMFANEYGKEIDWQRVFDSCQSISRRTFAATIFAIGEKYLTLDRERAKIPDNFCSWAADETDLLADLMSAGVFGGATESRKHTANMTLDAVSQSSKGKTAAKSLKSTLFPSADSLKNRYRYLKKNSLLLPIAWAQRIFTYIKNSGGKGNTRAEAVKLGGERISLLREYNIIK